MSGVLRHMGVGNVSSVVEAAESTYVSECPRIFLRPQRTLDLHN